jgi:hypothetical protein
MFVTRLSIDRVRALANDSSERFLRTAPFGLVGFSAAQTRSLTFAPQMRLSARTEMVPDFRAIEHQRKLSRLGIRARLDVAQFALDRTQVQARQHRNLTSQLDAAFFRRGGCQIEATSAERFWI